MYYNDDTVIYFDGNFRKAKDAGTDLYGQSLHYGYSVFEGIKSYSTDRGTRIFKAKEH
ncbi:branched-chain amino acid aminotransferase, partial [Chryseobacterium sp. PMSZPI]